MPKKILLSGASGFIGSYLSSFLTKAGYVVFPLSSKKEEGKCTYEDDLSAMDFDIVIHLAGENIFGRWSQKKKKKIESSRMQTTEKLIEKLKDHPPSLFMCASAVGFYGNRKEEVLTEESKKGEGFLSDLCQRWEEKARSLPKAKVTSLRFGMVLGRNGGAFAKLLPFIKLGLAAILGSGEQYLSWITLKDLAGLILFLIENPQEGPINAVSPHPVRQKEFIQRLAYAYHRPCFLHIPAFVMRLFFLELADEVFLASAKVFPKKIESLGYKFSHDTLEKAIAWL